MITVIKQVLRNQILIEQFRMPNEKISKKLSKQIATLQKSASVIKAELEDGKSPYFSPRRTRNQRKHIKIEEEPAAKIKKAVSVPQAIEAKVKQEVKSESVELKTEPEPDQIALKDEEPNYPSTSKEEKWMPANWEQVFANLRTMRSEVQAPVDTMGCHKCADEDADDKTKRFQILVALMLSSMTTDQVTFATMNRLKNEKLVPQNILKMDNEKLASLLNPVAFYKNKATYLQNTAKILIDKYDSDIPRTYNELVKLPGVGPKMANICMSAAWNIVSGIGVDVHVHRISNRLGWVRKATKDPEKTRLELEEWLPRPLWSEVNCLLVGFGQTVCKSVKPKCSECLNRSICPSAGLFDKKIKKK